MAAGRHIEICKNLNNSRTVRPIFTKFGTELRHDTAETPEVSEPLVLKIQGGRRRKTANLLKIEYLLNGSSYMHQIWYLSSASHPKQAYGPRMSNCIIQDGRRPPYWNLQKPEGLPIPVSPILTKFGTELRLDAAQTLDESKPLFSKIQDGRRRKT